MRSKEEEQEELPKWMNFACPSCGIVYGINALIVTIRKRMAWRNITANSTSLTS
jgi:hypothetical protein